MTSIKNGERRSNLTDVTNEKELFAYLNQKMESGKWQSQSTMWSKLSMLRTMILSQDGVDIKGTRLNETIQTWLKRQAPNHMAKQANMFLKEHVVRYLREAPMNLIDHKLILLVGVYTGLRCDTISQLEWEHVNLKKETVEIMVDFASKTDQCGAGTWFAFPKTADDRTLDPKILFNQYKAMIEAKDKKLLTGRLWVRMVQENNGKVQITRQVRGKEWIAGVPMRVAKWLGLPEEERYTGHTFRRTCAQWAADAGMSETHMQHHFGWKSAAMIQRYTKNSTYLKHAAAAHLDLESRCSESDSSSTSKTRTSKGLPEHQQKTRRAHVSRTRMKARWRISSDDNEKEILCVSEGKRERKEKEEEDDCTQKSKI